MNYAIEIQGLTKSYPDFKLDDIHLTLPSGCIMGLIGENGAGKSTTIKSILDLISIDSGEIRVLGESLKMNGAAVKEHLGVVMDESCFPENLSVKDVDKIMNKIYTTWDSHQYQQITKRFQLPDKKPFKQYSRGMKMKLSIAVALSHDSKLLILDEATSGLDPMVREELQDVFRDYIQDENHSILISSHILSDLEKICDYITFIHQGKILLSESKDDMMERYVLVKCSKEELDALDRTGIIGRRENQFGVEALMLREMVPNGFLVDSPTLEDIMLYHAKERSI